MIVLATVIAVMALALAGLGVFRQPLEGRVRTALITASGIGIGFVLGALMVPASQPTVIGPPAPMIANDAPPSAVVVAKATPVALPAPLDYVNQIGDLSLDVLDDAASTVPTRQTSLLLPRGHDLRVGGWAYDKALNGPFAAAYVILDHHTAFPVPYGAVRADVAKALGNQYSGTGYYGVLSTANLSPGKHPIEVIFVAAGGRKVVRLPVHLLLTVQ